MMSRVLLTLVLISSLSWVACKKNDADAPNSDYVLKGLLYFSSTGTAVGMTGRPDDSARLDSTVLNVFPTLVNRGLYFFVESQKMNASTFTYRVVHATYPDAPDSLITGGIEYPERYPVVVENKNLVGQEIVRHTALFEENAGFRYQQIMVDMSNKPRGFYRLFVETNTGTKLRMGLYKY